MYWPSYMFYVLALMTDSIVFKCFTFVFVSAHCLNVCSENSLLSVSHPSHFIKKLELVKNLTYCFRILNNMLVLHPTL